MLCFTIQYAYNSLNLGHPCVTFIMSHPNYTFHFYLNTLFMIIFPYLFRFSATACTSARALTRGTSEGVTTLKRTKVRGSGNDTHLTKTYIFCDSTDCQKSIQIGGELRPRSRGLAGCASRYWRYLDRCHSRLLFQCHWTRLLPETT